MAKMSNHGTLSLVGFIKGNEIGHPGRVPIDWYGTNSKDARPDLRAVAARRSVVELAGRASSEIVAGQGSPAAGVNR